MAGAHFDSIQPNSVQNGFRFGIEKSRSARESSIYSIFGIASSARTAAAGSSPVFNPALPTVHHIETPKFGLENPSRIGNGFRPFLSIYAFKSACQPVYLFWYIKHLRSSDRKIHIEFRITPTKDVPNNLLRDI
nr:hypothetical protein X990_5691 [Burkholderia pseudomallei MSHR4868]